VTACIVRLVRVCAGCCRAHLQKVSACTFVALVCAVCTVVLLSCARCLHAIHAAGVVAGYHVVAAAYPEAWCTGVISVACLRLCVCPLCTCHDMPGVCVLRV
jgi:predicted lysophospholipase L1 biosynthesis ABC-type transport system permease subunit